MKSKAPRNQTLTLTENEQSIYKKNLFFHNNENINIETITNKTICADLFNIIDFLPPDFADLLIIDPPYNLTKNFNGYKFSKTNDELYYEYLKSWFPKIINTLKPTGSVYLCGDWKSTSALYQIMQNYTIIRNRIIWQREKGRGAQSNWKNACEDIWFGTKSNNYYFNVEAVKQKI